VRFDEGRGLIEDAGDLIGENMVGWSWRYESADGEPVAPADLPPAETFPTQSDAESWLGEEWRPLLAAGVARVSLLEGDRVVYGPMSLDPAT
jgi:hypothetical protein